MKFNWDGFTEEDFVDYCAKVENNMFGHSEYYIGCVRVGDLCFDLLITWLDREFVLYYDLYVGGIDDGYGYGNNDYPYTDGGGGSFEESMIGYTYDTFVKISESKFEDFIENSYTSSKYNLAEKANKPLHIW